MTELEQIDSSVMMADIPVTMEGIAETYEKGRCDIVAHVYGEGALCRAVREMCAKHEHGNPAGGEANVKFVVHDKDRNVGGIPLADENEIRFRVTITLGELEQSVVVVAEDIGEYMKRLETFATILNLASNLMADKSKVLVWFASEKIPTFGGKTAKQVLLSGEGFLIEHYLNGVIHGVFE